MNCPHCQIEVGSDAKVCPICQSPLIGEKEQEYWPHYNLQLKHLSIFWKFVLFIGLTTCVVCSFTDFLFVEQEHFHWSVLVSGWIIASLWLIFRVIKTHKSVPKIIFISMLTLSVMMFFTGWYGGFRDVSINYVIPIFCCVTLVLNFIFSFIDAGFTRNALVYLLLNIGVGVVPYIALFIHRGSAPVAWKVALLISVITFIGLAVFKGKTMISEIHRRLHF